jgi:transcriptional regulator with AAA-type ATPase domain
VAEEWSETLKNRARSAEGDAQSLGPMLFRILFADDPASVLSARYPLRQRDVVLVRRGQAASSREEGGSLIVEVADRYASSKHARIERSGTSWVASDESSTNGTIVDGTRLAPGERRLLRDGALVEVGHTAFLFRAACFGEGGAEGAPEVESAATQTLNPEWQRELRVVERLAAGRHELLISGESGAGKEALAKFVHERSGRPGALVTVNCGAMAEGLLEDELFGHVRGAFSGAQQDRDGLIRAADAGTLFLDEIGDMSMPMQARFLRVIEDHRVRPLGSEREHPVDLRVIAATHRDLDALVAQGSFRHDLHARLGLVRVTVPPLRERREDLGLLIRSVMRERGGSVRFDPDAARLLLLHSWPYNVRELQRVLSAAAAVASAEGAEAVLLPAHLLPFLKDRRPNSASPERPARQLDERERALRDQLVALLREHGGNLAAVARAMGKGRTQIQRWVSRFGIDPKKVPPA